MRKYFNLFCLFFIIVAIIFFTSESVFVLKQEHKKTDKRIIVIDPGHGGRDPGKVGVNGVLEKDINLEIAFKLKLFLEKNDFQVIMTREEDIGLYSESDTNKKRVDLNNRVDIINNSGAIFAISIHQNSFQQESCKGTQVFYHSKSQEGKELAQVLQEQVKKTINADNNRVAKSNESYYMIKKTQCPLVIIECGFLSNYTEANLLGDESYQEKMAWAFFLGITNYISTLD